MESPFMAIMYSPTLNKKSNDTPIFYKMNDAHYDGQYFADFDEDFAIQKLFKRASKW